jgi:hypothetical protein
MCSNCGRFETAKPDLTEGVLTDIGIERERQDVKWGQQRHPDGTVRNATTIARAEDFQRMCAHAAEHGEVTWSDILFEEFYEAMAETDPVALREELVQVAAVAAAWIEDMDSR